MERRELLCTAKKPRANIARWRHFLRLRVRWLGLGRPNVRICSLLSSIIATDILLTLQLALPSVARPPNAPLLRPSVPLPPVLRVAEESSPFLSDKAPLNQFRFRCSPSLRQPIRFHSTQGLGSRRIMGMQARDYHHIFHTQVTTAAHRSLTAIYCRPFALDISES